MKSRLAFLLVISSLSSMASFSDWFGTLRLARGEILSAVPREDFQVIGDLTTQLSITGIEEAKKALVQGDFRGAREQLQKVSQTNKDLPLPELIISGWLFELNFPVMATQVLQQVGFTHGNRQDVQLQMAQVAMTQARFYEASLLVEAALKSEPEPEWSDAFKKSLVTQMHETRGAVEERRGRMAEAKAIYAQLLEENPNSVKSNLGAARATFALGEIEQSESHFRKLEELVPDKAPVTEVALATLFLTKNDLENGEAWLKKGLERTGHQNSIVRLDYAKFLLKRNQFAEARTVLTQGKPADSLKNDFAFHIALADQMAGNFDKSLPILLKLYKASPNNFPIANHLAWAMLQSPDSKVLSQGVRLAQQNFLNNPTSLEAIATAAWANFKRGDLKSAGELVSRPLPSRNFSRDAAYFFSEVLLANGKDAEAKGIRDRVETAPGEFYHAKLASSSTQGDGTNVVPPSGGNGSNPAASTDSSN